ncbi:hypothetical protein QNI16_18260 [Cytophagaceae bacterium YF14B1]|uniref:Uncharacterized protein n=1 Tax=Xanthocytophaga flava TaxID=3048013 RepID=A0AAE3QTP2_9BACT|nr:hypothetical protein [Xanthocytophaga flavus]MDJ1482453.1 hypothetical protein [Xanthocytophaga flavus]
MSIRQCISSHDLLFRFLHPFTLSKVGKVLTFVAPDYYETGLVRIDHYFYPGIFFQQQLNLNS